jgi:hypothetical protein
MITETKLQILGNLTEAVVDSQKREITIDIIKAGVSQRKRYYSPEVTETSAPVFEGVRMYIDHPAEKDAGKARSINDWGATILETWYDPDTQTTKGRAGVRNKIFWENWIQPALDGGYLNELGVSINAVGPTRVGKIGGENVQIVESIKKAFSADFVSEASAGGKVTNVLESAQHEEEIMGLEKLTLDELIEVRPDLVEEILEADEGSDLDTEIMTGLLESMYMITDEVAALRDDVETVVDGFAEGIQNMSEDIDQLLESAGYDPEDYDGYDYLDEGVDNRGRHAQYDDDYGYDPEVYEAIDNLQEGLDVQAEENLRLREDLVTLTSRDLAIAKLEESNLPEITQERLLPALIGLSSGEMDELITGEVEHVNAILESQGGIPIYGGGSEFNPGEWEQEAVDAAQSRLDRIVGVDD